MKVLNTQKGPRGINTKTGPVLIEPGQEVDVEISEEELKVAKASGWFSISGEEAEKPSEREELKKQAGELGLQYPGNISNTKLKEMIDAKLAEPPPAPPTAQ